MKKHIPTLACLLTLTITASLRAEPAHEHGIAHLQVALEGQALRADFDLPGMDLLGGGELRPARTRPAGL